MDQNYLIKHWLTTLILAPFLLWLYEIIFSPISGLVVGLFEVYPITFIFSFLFSLPTVIVYLLIFKLLIKQNINPALSKIILISLTVIGITSTILIIGGSLSWRLIFAFSLSSIIAGSIFKINTHPDTEKSPMNV